MTTGTPSAAHNWTVRPYREGDEAGLLRLFVEGGWSPRTEAQLRWRLLTLPCRAPTIWLAEDRGRIAGSYCGTPIRMRLNGAPVDAIHGSDAMTLPAYRRQGILTAAAGAAAREWAAAAYRLQIGVVWGTWGSRRAALGWVPLFRMIWVRRWICPERALARRARLPAALQRAAAIARPWDRLSPDPLRPPIPDVTVRELVEPEPALDRLWARAAKEWDSLVVRDRDWVAWRYFAAPGYGYRVLLAERAGEPVGYLAFRIERGPHGGTVGRIADLFGAPAETEARRALLRGALDRFRATGVERALALVVEGGPIHRELVAARFAAGQGDDFFIMPFDPDLPIDELRDPKRWHLMGGDFDVC